ncbi:hypothetical protein [Paenibacillus taichungensis]|uniref:hypothetical protein n=1 Tax=Paenibacillus taichungensis TaxID=484184 RepID=UPI0039A39576
MNLHLEEVATYEEAKYAMFSGKFLNELKLSESKLYELRHEYNTIYECNDYYVINDKGDDSFSSLIAANRKLYK